MEEAKRIRLPKPRIHSMVQSTALLSAVHGFVRVLGMVNRVFLSRWIGAEGMGLLEMSNPAFVLPSALVSGASPALMRLTARAIARGDEEGARQRLGGARRLLLLMGFVSMVILMLVSGWYARSVGDMRVQPIIIAYAPCALILGMSIAYNGWFYGLQRIRPPAVSELIEQCVRVLLVIAFAIFCPAWPLVLLVSLAAVATTVGELCGVLHIQKAAGSVKGNWSEALLFLREMIPYSASRILSTALSSASALIVPLLLVRGGLSQSDAMAQFGTINGMTAPLLFFPLAITGSLSTVLAPKLAAKQALGEERSLQSSVRIALEAACGIGLPTLLLYATLSPLAGLLYKTPLAGELLRVMCPATLFLCLNSTSVSLLNGLGKQKRVFVHTLIHACLMLLLNGLFIGVLSLGIYGYAYSFLITTSVICLLNVGTLLHAVRMGKQVPECFTRPLVCALPLCALTLLQTGVIGLVCGVFAYGGLYAALLWREKKRAA